jgi:hypothetical protein
LLVILLLIIIPRRCGSEKDQIKSKIKIKSKSKKKPVEDERAAKARIQVIAGCPRIEMRDRLLKSGMTVPCLFIG